MAASLAVRPRPNRPTPGTSTTRGLPIELGLGVAGGRVLAGEIGVVVGDELGDRLAHGAGKIVELARLRRRDHQRPVLGADDVVRRHHAALAVGGELGAVHIAQDLGRGAELGDEADGLGALGLDGGGAANDRGDFGGGSAVAAASGRAGKTMGRPWRNRLSASDTISIMRS